MEGSVRGFFLHYPCMCPGELRKTAKNLSQDSLSPGRDLNLGHLEYEVGEEC
jgi:hypothetical protein